MYIPPYYREEETAKLFAFMSAHPFATLVSSDNSKPVANHLPFIVEKRGDAIFLIAHMAKANPQWQGFPGAELLVIFQGPHAYISPSHYEKQQNVPTWNYIAVHACGKAKLLEGMEAQVNVMERSIQAFEEKFYAQWKSLSPEYINNMLKAIVAFEIEISSLKGKFKLSQNKTQNEQQQIIHSFENSGDALQKEIAEEMKKIYKS